MRSVEAVAPEPAEAWVLAGYLVLAAGHGRHPEPNSIGLLALVQLDVLPVANMTAYHHMLISSQVVCLQTQSH